MRKVALANKTANQWNWFPYGMFPILSFSHYCYTFVALYLLILRNIDTFLYSKIFVFLRSHTFSGNFSVRDALSLCRYVDNTDIGIAIWQDHHCVCLHYRLFGRKVSKQINSWQPVKQTVWWCCYKLLFERKL